MSECNIWRLVFSKKKLSAAARTTLQSLLEDVSYTCGASLEDLHLPMGIQVVIWDHRCGDPIEKLYYSVGYEDICIFCAASGDLVVPSSAYHICPTCATTKEPVQKRKKKYISHFFCGPSCCTFFSWHLIKFY